MFHDFPYGALNQLTRFVTGLPRAFGWSGPSTATPDAPAEEGFTVPNFDRTWSAPATSRTFTAPAFSRTFTVPDPE